MRQSFQLVFLWTFFVLLVLIFLLLLRNTQLADGNHLSVCLVISISSNCKLCESGEFPFLYPICFTPSSAASPSSCCRGRWSEIIHLLLCCISYSLPALFTVINNTIYVFTDYYGSCPFHPLTHTASLFFRDHQELISFGRSSFSPPTIWW